MRAVVLYEHGDNDKLKFEPRFADPTPGPGDVVVKVEASSLNYHDVFTRRGMPGIKVPMPAIIGLDVAGTIAELGEGVTDWKVGDRVLVDPVNRMVGGLVGETSHGGLAELCRVAAHQLIRIPEGVSFDDAAALPTAYGTAKRMMVTNAKVQPGEKVLVLGASGGVGVCCVLLGKRAGAHVIACAGSQDKLDRLKSLGADDVIDYKKEDFMQAVHERYGKPRIRGGKGGGVDVAINFTGGDTWVKSLRCLRTAGRQLTCGATAGFDPKEDIRFIWTFELEIKGSQGWAKQDLVDLLDMVQRKELPVVIDHRLPLEEGARGLGLLEDRQVFGKVVVKP